MNPYDKIKTLEAQAENLGKVILKMQSEIERLRAENEKLELVAEISCGSRRIFVERVEEKPNAD